MTWRDKLRSFLADRPFLRAMCSNFGAVFLCSALGFRAWHRDCWEIAAIGVLAIAQIVQNRRERLLLDKQTYTGSCLRREFKGRSIGGLMTWRDKLRPVVAKVITENPGADGKGAACAALRTAYPLTERRYWQYKVWRDEIAVQTGKRKRADRPRRRIASRTLRRLNAEEVREWYARRQLKLFELGGASISNSFV